MVESEYCITLDKIPESFYAEIAGNDEQWEEWEKLFVLSELPKDLFNGGGEADRMTILKQQPFLLLDTKFFNPGFKNRLLATFDNLDEQTDGLLINSENFQALELLQEKYKEQIKCVYIDPPYNTGKDGFVYKDNFQHSSWLQFNQNRYSSIINLISNNGIVFTSIDDCEIDNLRLLCNDIFGKKNFIAQIIWFSKYTVANDTRYLSQQHEYLLVYGKNKDAIDELRLPRTKEMNKRYTNPDKDPKGAWKATPLHAKSGKGESYTYVFSNGVVWKAPEGRYPRFGKETLQRLDKENKLWFGKDGTAIPSVKTYLSDLSNGRVSGDLWHYDEVGHTHLSNEELASILKKGKFENPKPSKLIKKCIQLSSLNISCYVMDYFAGSGTTAHAVINLNRQESIRYKYILVEMGDYFDTVTKPRIQKVIYSEDWKEGKPVDRKGSSHIFKYMRLESYEDTLNNLRASPLPKAAQDMFSENEHFYEDYMLGYLLNTETKDSLLTVQDFRKPFDYQLNITENNESKTSKIDLVETFNYLIGLKVNTIKQIDGYRLVTGTKRTGETTLVIWRDMDEKDNAALMDFFQSQGWHEEGKTFQHIYINGDNTVAMLRKETDNWQVFLTERAFLEAMFEVRDV